MRPVDPMSMRTTPFCSRLLILCAGILALAALGCNERSSLARSAAAETSSEKTAFDLGNISKAFRLEHGRWPANPGELRQFSRAPAHHWAAGDWDRFPDLTTNTVDDRLVLKYGGTQSRCKLTVSGE